MAEISWLGFRVWNRIRTAKRVRLRKAPKNAAIELAPKSTKQYKAIQHNTGRSNAISSQCDISLFYYNWKTWGGCQASYTKFLQGIDKKLNHLLKQRVETEFHSLSITLFARTIPNRARCNTEGRVKKTQYHKDTGLTAKWKISYQNTASLGQDQIGRPRVPSTNLHLSQVAETEDEIVLSLVLERLSAVDGWFKLNKLKPGIDRKCFNL